MKKRIFLGIALSPELQEKIGIWQKQNNDFPVRFIKSENAHLTLVPPWLESNVLRIKEKMLLLRGEFKQFVIKFDKISLGPTLRHPRLIWLEGESKEFGVVKKRLEEYFNNPDRREPRPHITIARFNAADFQNFPKKELEEKIDWREKVENVTLYESLGNSEYKILHAVKI